MNRFSLSLSLLLLAGCASPAPVAPISSESPTTTSSAAPSSAPTASTPSTAAAGFRLGEGQALKSFAYQWISGVYRDTARDQLLVTDAVDGKTAPYRFMLRKLNADGGFLSNARLKLEAAQDPTAVGGLAFDLRGIPFYGYRQGDQFRLMKLVTSTVVPVDPSDYPVAEFKRAGVSTLASIGRELLVGILSLDSDKELTEEQKRSMTGGKIVYARAEESEQPSALFQIPDPLYPTARMAFAPNGDLYLAGPTREGKQSVIRLQGDQKLSTVQADLGALPDAMWVSPQGELLMAFDGINKPASLRRLSAEGAPNGEAELKYAGGGYMSTLRGLAVDANGALIVGGRGFNAQGQTVDGLYRFEVTP